MTMGGFDASDPDSISPQRTSAGLLRLELALKLYLNLGLGDFLHKSSRI